ncbi:MAG TPA: hypothetical protein VLM85_27140 [Polyangiaceae bacterium]|nr:hypothetical protein [Polyangiaceae bacterium]
MVRNALIPLFLAATGCSAVVAGSPSEGDAQSASVTGVVVVEKTVTDDATRGEASARFVRVRGAVDADALRLVGAALDLPNVGECASAGLPATTAHPVELLDVGGVSIESAGQKTALVGRQLPDVVDLVSGTVYSARIDARDSVQVLVGGTADVPAFSLRAEAPEAPADVRVAALDSGALDVSWSGGADVIYLDVNGSRCTFADEGRALVPASVIGDATAASLHRVRREKLSIPGLDGGELRFDFARSVTLARR